MTRKTLARVIDSAMFAVACLVVSGSACLWLAGLVLTACR